MGNRNINQTNPCNNENYPCRYFHSSNNTTISPFGCSTGTNDLTIVRTVSNFGIAISKPNNTTAIVISRSNIAFVYTRCNWIGYAFWIVVISCSGARNRYNTTNIIIGIRGNCAFIDTTWNNTLVFTCNACSTGMAGYRTGKLTVFNFAICNSSSIKNRYLYCS